MKRPTHVYQFKVAIHKGATPIDVALNLNAKRRSKSGALTVSAFEVTIDGIVIIGWSTFAAIKLERRP